MLLIVSSFMILLLTSTIDLKPSSLKSTPFLVTTNSGLNPFAKMKSQEFSDTFSLNIARSETAVSTRAMYSFADSFEVIFIW